MFEFVSRVITNTCIADTSRSRENVLGCQLSFIFSTSDRPLEPTPHARHPHTRTQNRYGCQNVRNAVTSRMRNADDAESGRLRTRPGSIKRNGTDGLSGLRIHDLRMVSPCSSCSPCQALTLRRDRIATALPPRWDDPRPPAQSLWAATVSGARRRLKPPLTPLASPRQVEAPFPRAYSAYELNSAVLPSLLATPHPVHTVAKVPPVAKLPAVETSPPVARSETRATP